jgi:hypothetical protein
LENSARSSTSLDEILNHQREPFDRTSLHYSNRKEVVNEEASTCLEQQEKKEPRTMLILSKTQSKLKTTEGKNGMNHKRQILLTKIESRKLSHQYGIIKPSMKTIYIAIVIHVMNLVIKH